MRAAATSRDDGAARRVVATVGKLDVTPGGINAIASHVTAWVAARGVREDDDAGLMIRADVGDHGAVDVQLAAVLLGEHWLDAPDDEAAKRARAEPVAALYEQGRVSHVGAMPGLEDQMALMGPDGFVGEGSPDRLDAAVWALTDLMLGLQPHARTGTIAGMY